MSDLSQESTLKKVLSLPVLVAALGYMVDMYDLFLFSIVRVPSLREIGVPEGEAMLKQGIYLLNLQTAGLLIGGIVWGILGDKRGRLSVLFGSILIYSLANIANGFVTTVDQYAVLRFIAGFGLAGELGAGITLVSEILPRTKRGYGTTLVALMGLPGSIAAYFVVQIFDWRTSYIVGGVLGLMLLIMRVSVLESGMFSSVKHKNIKRGDVALLFGNGKRALKYLLSILIGLPIWFVVGILITFSPEFARELGISESFNAGKAVMLAFTGQVAGNLITGFLSQYLKSRKKVIALFILLSLSFVFVYLWAPIESENMFYVVCMMLGLFNGYWTLFITVAAELFGTNLRATVATTVPNFVRGSVIILAWLFTMLRGPIGMTNGALVTGLIAFAIALISLRYLEETFSKDLDYVEE
ncbi:MAG TPA: MFS transporter [Cyclobacteriaceae bacterium]|nr:MFS transporter [Cyclobacteriaceae bacterium]